MWEGAPARDRPRRVDRDLQDVASIAVRAAHDRGTGLTTFSAKPVAGGCPLPH